MKVVVATPERDSVAHRALEMEGIPHQELFLEEDTSYGDLFYVLWGSGEPFVLVEWDIVPWPGAVAGLADCNHSWCCNRYPLHRGNLATAFGFSKFRPEGPAAEEWRRTDWWLLDGLVVPELQKGGFFPPHVHEPPVAHARRSDDAST